MIWIVAQSLMVGRCPTEPSEQPEKFIYSLLASAGSARNLRFLSIRRSGNVTVAL